MASRGIQRLERIIQHRAAHIILHEIKDPRRGFVTITRVELAADLSVCTIHYSVMGTPGDLSKTEHALRGATPFIQRRIAEGLRTRVTPRIQFVYDPSVEDAIRMSTLLRQLREERGEEEGGDGGTEGEPGSADDQVDPGVTDGPGSGDDAGASPPPSAGATG